MGARAVNSRGFGDLGGTDRGFAVAADLFAVVALQAQKADRGNQRHQRDQQGGEAEIGGGDGPGGAGGCSDGALRKGMTAAASAGEVKMS